MSKVYKSKVGDKLVVYIPYDVISALDIKDGDDVDFFKFSGKSFLFAKKNDIVDLLTKLQTTGPSVPVQQPSATIAVDAKELAILQKLDTLRYNDRTKDKVNAMTPQSETIADHEKRLRRVERWMWALPAALITAVGSIGVAYLETHR